MFTSRFLVVTRATPRCRKWTHNQPPGHPNHTQNLQNKIHIVCSTSQFSNLKIVARYQIQMNFLASVMAVSPEPWLIIAGHPGTLKRTENRGSSLWQRGNRWYNTSTVVVCYVMCWEWESVYCYEWSGVRAHQNQNVVWIVLTMITVFEIVQLYLHYFSRCLGDFAKSILTCASSISFFFMK